MTSMRGFYLALEGAEGTGKSTVGQLLADSARAAGETVAMVREPGGTPLGEEIRRLLLHADDMTPWAEAALFAASRAQLVLEVVRPALEAGALVISDRTYYSSLAYQGYARGLGVEAVRSLNEAVLLGFIPDLVAVIEVDPDVALGRQTDPDRIGGAGSEFQRLVAEGYRKLVAEEPERVVSVDGGGSPDSVAAKIASAVEDRWRRVR